MGGGSAGPGAHTSWSSADFDSNSSPTRNYGNLSSIEPSKVHLEKVHNVSDAAIISEIDCIMRRHTDRLLQAIDGLGARLSQLESRTRQLELSVDDLKVSVGNNHGSTEGKMRQIENILLEVQSCVQDLKYKQEVMNAQVQPKKLPLSKLVETQETQNIAQTNPAQQTTPAPAPQQFNQQFSLASLQPFPISISPCSPPPPQQSIHQLIQLPTQYPPTPTPAVPQLDTYFPPASQTQEAPSQQFLLPPAQQQQTQTLPPPSGIVEHQFFQLNPPSLYPHQQLAAADNSPLTQFQPPMVVHHQEGAQIASQTYPPSFQQFCGLYDSPSEPYSYSGSSSHYGNDLEGDYRPLSFGTGGNTNTNNFPRTASAASGGTGPAESENRVPIDDVVDRVARMGFPREGIRETVHKMTENGQAVDLNVVLDKLMNDGKLQPPPRAWFGR